MVEETLSERTEQAIAIARTWIGTPYQHQACLKGHGVDCVGLIKGIYEELYEVKTREVVNYTPDWGDSNGNESLLKIARKYMRPVTPGNVDAGHVVLMRWKRRRVAKHALLMTSSDTAIHAYNRSPVCEIHLSKWWLDKIVYAFDWPEKAVT